MSSPLSAMLTLVPHLKHESYPRCACPKWLRWSRDGKQHRQSTGTRIWGTVEKAVAQFEQRLKAGESPATTSGRTPSRRFPQLAETFMTRKLSLKGSSRQRRGRFVIISNVSRSSWPRGQISIRLMSPQRTSYNARPLALVLALRNRGRRSLKSLQRPTLDGFDICIKLSNVFDKF